MPDELMGAFIEQMVENLEGMLEALRLLQQHHQVAMAEQEMSAKASQQEAGIISPERMRDVLVKKSREGKAEQIRELLSLFHAEKFSDVNPEHYGQLLKMIDAI